MELRGGIDSPIRLLLIDDHELLLDSLRQAFAREPDFEVVGRAASLAQGLAVGATCTPDIVVLDLHLGNDDAVGSIGKFVALESNPRVVILSASQDRRHATRALEAGAAGYLTKQQPLAELVAGLRGIASGRTALDPALLGGVIQEMTRDDPNRLTAREQEVLQLLAAGFDAKRIAAELIIATNTVRNHVQRILEKLGATSRLEAVAKARALGLLDD